MFWTSGECSIMYAGVLSDHLRIVWLPDCVHAKWTALIFVQSSTYECKYLVLYAGVMYAAVLGECS